MYLGLPYVSGEVSCPPSHVLLYIPAEGSMQYIQHIIRNLSFLHGITRLGFQILDLASSSAAAPPPGRSISAGGSALNAPRIPLICRACRPRN